jgi:plasmid stability protein
MSEHTVTVTVPPALYDRLKQRAAQRQRSLEDEMVLALAATMPAEAKLPANLTDVLVSMGALDDVTLWQMARSRVADEDVARLTELGDKRQRAGLSDEELREAEALVHRHDRVLVVRAEAMALLKQRGYDVSVLLPAG